MSCVSSVDSASLKRLSSMFCVALLCAAASAQSAPTTNPPAQDPSSPLQSTNSPAETRSEPGQRDLVAARYLTACAGCHSLTGAKLTGPELSPATGWPMDQLKVAIKKMESKVGPLSDQTVQELAELLKARDVRDRLEAESKRIAELFMAKMEPANASLGKQLFFGKVGLKNGGLACSACHLVEGSGGNLGLPLNGIFAKTGGELPLISAIEQAKFKIMEPHYLRHPVTRQEAMHLAKYLSTLDPADKRMPDPVFARTGGGLALVALAGMVAVLKIQRKKRTRDTRLQRRRNQA